jgi:hypothetical protein
MSPWASRATFRQIIDLAGELKCLRNREKGSIDGVATATLTEVLQTIDAMIRHADEPLSTS